MTKKIRESQIYDDMYSEGGYQGVYNLPYYHSYYYPLFKKVLREIYQRNIQRMLEVGCGNGVFAQMLLEKSDIDYHGFDFSSVAIEIAITRSGQPDRFYVADATLPESYKTPYDGIICTEVLEHVEEDLKVIQNWRSGAICICSVPNFDSEYHVRYFQTKDEVLSRYSPLIDIDKLIVLKKPVLSDISWANYFRQIRWNRYNPKRLIEIVGFGDFNKVGGWFLVSGKKR